MTNENKQALKLAKKLEIKANMISLGERIPWGSDSQLMLEASNYIKDALQPKPSVDVEGLEEVIYNSVLYNCVVLEFDYSENPKIIAEDVKDFLQSQGYLNPPEFEKVFQENYMDLLHTDETQPPAVDGLVEALEICAGLNGKDTPATHYAVETAKQALSNYKKRS